MNAEKDIFIAEARRDASPAKASADPTAWGEVIHPIRFPIPVGNDGGKLTEIVFREPNGEQLEAIDDLNLKEGDKPTVRQTILIISILSGQPVEVIRKFHRADIVGAAEAIAPLLEV